VTYFHRKITKTFCNGTLFYKKNNKKKERAAHGDTRSLFVGLSD